MPLLSRSGRHRQNGGRLQIGTLGAIRSERRAASDRNRWAAYVRIRSLGFAIEKADGVAACFVQLLGDRAIAVLLDAGETPEGAASRFQNLSPVSWALTVADQRDLPWVVVVQGDRLRLYPVELGVGVGRRGRTETWLELRQD